MAVAHPAKKGPLYEQIRSFVAERVKAEGALGAHHFPDDFQLAQQFETDPETIRDALDQIASDLMLDRLRDASSYMRQDKSRARGQVERSEFAMKLQVFLDWASDEALDELCDDIVAKHLAAASDRLRSRFG